ncbi:hypothetical protein SAMN05216323_11032 [Williamwhitmania taraxaci]|uniref:Uncharacterized protein n=1 Tax=Williamwhitmania taraxaci TaxID=1640674 RepID=A0A1G6SVA1_9BACT|nr:hypothetical protein SAMN05216323_11032 [Williamwhitmania taraxaci]
MLMQDKSYIVVIIIISLLSDKKIPVETLVE